jgi:integrase
MSRPKNLVPTYKLHKSTGLARAWVNGRWVSLGKHGSPESEQAFRRLVAEVAAVGPAAVAPSGPALTIDQLLVAYWEHVEGHYRAADGKPSKEQDEIKRALAPVHKLYGATPPATFGPKALATVRAEMVNANWCRTLVNRRVGRVVRAFKWGVTQELVPVTTFEALRTVPGLQKGRTEVRESDPVKPVPAEHVAATLPRLNRHVRAMVELQQLTGMRPGEVCALTLAQVDRTAEPWVYAPTTHKGTWRGKPRAIPFGPKARALLMAFLQDEPGGIEAFDPTAAVFSPARERAERSVRLRAARKTPVQPSQQSRRTKKPKRVPGAFYTPGALAHAVTVAAEKAGAPHWHPNQLRHAHATAVRREYGLEAAGAVLGHSRMSATEVYAERDFALAARIAEANG